jgi:hypothetical protein
MKQADDFPRMDRRTALKWIGSAAASIPVLGPLSFGAGKPETKISPDEVSGYGPDPDILKVYHPGDLWPLTFSDEQRRLVITLCDIIMPADDQSPSASSLGVHDFIDEWISSPYPEQAPDRSLILKGLTWLDEEAERRGTNDFISLNSKLQNAICLELAKSAKTNRKDYPGSFFYLMRNLVAGGYYTTPAGMKDIGYVGNVARSHAPGPPPEVLEHLGLK